MTIHQVLESLIFASPKPISTAELLAALKATGESCEKPEAQDFAQADEDRILAVLIELQQQIEDAGRAFQLMEQVNGWVFVSRPEYAPWVRQLFPEAKPTRLSGPALETLAIIAYRQPVTRADIEAVRGVAVDGVMQVLLDRSLVRISGRADVPGRPLLYSTTGYFLEHFGLKTVHELPNSEELRRVDLPKAPPPEEKPAPKGRKRAKDAEPQAAEGAAAAPADSRDGGGTASPALESAPGEGAPESAGEHPLVQDANGVPEVDSHTPSADPSSHDDSAADAGLAQHAGGNAESAGADFDHGAPAGETAVAPGEEALFAPAPLLEKNEDHEPA